VSAHTPGPWRVEVLVKGKWMFASRITSRVEMMALAFRVGSDATVRIIPEGA